MQNGNGKTKKTKKPKYTIKDFRNETEVFDKETQARIDATIAVLKAIEKQEKLKVNGKTKIPAF